MGVIVNYTQNPLLVDAVEIKCQEFTADTRLYNPTTESINLVNLDTPIYVDSNKYFPFPFTFKPPESNEEALTEATLQISVINQLVYASLYNIKSRIEIIYKQYLINQLELPEVITFYDEGRTLTEATWHKATETKRAYFLANNFSNNGEVLAMKLVFSLSNDIGVGVKSLDPSLTPNTFETAY